MSVREFQSKKAQEEVSRIIDILVGAILAFAWLCVFLFHPALLDDDLVPAQVLAAFVLGMLLSLYIEPLRRALTPKKWREDNVDRAGRAAFVEQVEGPSVREVRNC